MPSNAANPPLPPGKRTSTVPYEGKYFCCNNIAFIGIEQCEKTRDGNPPTPVPVTNLTGEVTTSAANLVHFFKWAALYYDGTPPLQSHKEMNINIKTWFIQVKQLKSGLERYFFPELGSTPFSQLTYSFLEVAKQDLTFPNKEIQKCAHLAIMCCYPRTKRDEECPEHKKPYAMRKGRAFEVSIWERKDVLSAAPSIREQMDAWENKEKGKGKEKAKCVGSDDQNSD